MAKKTTSISMRMDAELKENAEKLFSELGLNLTTACSKFFRQAVRQGEIPFEISLKKPNDETIAAMKEAIMISKDPTVDGYSNVDELFEDLHR